MTGFKRKMTDAQFLDAIDRALRQGPPPLPLVLYEGEHAGGFVRVVQCRKWRDDAPGTRTPVPDGPVCIEVAVGDGEAAEVLTADQVLAWIRSLQAALEAATAALPQHDQHDRHDQQDHQQRPHHDPERSHG